jgi:ABC-type transport system involved in cytochrome bd biosynthesis fused ATPase/permease subunit
LGDSAVAQPPVADPVPSKGKALAFERIGLVYSDGTEALTDIDLEIAPGELVSVVGSSGCGKSSLLRIASGLLTPTSGTVRQGAAEIGYVFQMRHCSLGVRSRPTSGSWQNSVVSTSDVVESLWRSASPGSV